MCLYTHALDCVSVILEASGSGWLGGEVEASHANNRDDWSSSSLSSLKASATLTAISSIDVFSLSTDFRPFRLPVCHRWPEMFSALQRLKDSPPRWWLVHPSKDQWSMIKWLLMSPMGIGVGSILMSRDRRWFAGRTATIKSFESFRCFRSHLEAFPTMLCFILLSITPARNVLQLKVESKGGGRKQSGK